MYNTHSIKETIIKDTIVTIQYTAEMRIHFRKYIKAIERTGQNVKCVFLLFVIVVTFYI